MPRPDLTSPLVFWACVLTASVLAAPLCLLVTLYGAMFWLYGVELLWTSVSDLNRRPEDGYVVLFTLPVALLLWLGTVWWIVAACRRWRYRARARTPRAGRE